MSQSKESAQKELIDLTKTRAEPIAQPIRASLTTTPVSPTPTPITSDSIHSAEQGASKKSSVEGSGVGSGNTMGQKHINELQALMETHPSMQQALQNRISTTNAPIEYPLTQDWYDTILESIHTSFCRTTQASQDESRRQALLSHCQTLIECAEKLWPERVSAAAGNVLFDIGNVLLSQLGDPNSALVFYKRALVINKLIYGPEHIETAKILASIGNAFGILGDTHRKKTFLERALVVFERIYEPDHIEIAKILHNLGNAYGDLGDAKRQKELLERALTIKERIHGPDHIEIAKILHNLGNAYGNLGNVKRRKELLERALVINERAYGPKHALTAITLAKLGMSYKKLDDIKKAVDCLERAFKIGNALHGIDHTTTRRIFTTLNNTRAFDTLTPQYSMAQCTEDQTQQSLQQNTSTPSKCVTP